MAYTDLSLTGLTGGVILPNGINIKVTSFNCTESRRWKDSEGFIDLGAQTGKLTGYGLSGRIVGYVMNNNAIGFGTSFENVQVTLQAASGQTLVFNATFMDFSWDVATGNIQTCGASFRSNGIYSISF